MNASIAVLLVRFATARRRALDREAELLLLKIQNALISAWIA
jgi:hypothetical protein